MTHCRFRSLRAPSPLASLIALQFLVAGPLFTEEPASQRSVSQPSSIETVVDDGPLPNERDDLQWLEAMHSPEVLAWARERDTRARASARQLTERDAIARRIEESSDYRRASVPIVRRGRAFYTSYDPNLTRVSLHLRPGAGAEQTLIDGEALMAEEGLRLDRVVWPSPDGRRVAYGVRPQGSRWMTLRVRDIESGRDLDDRLVGLVAGSSNLAWFEDGSGFTYERFAMPGDAELQTAPLRDEEVRLHRLGTRQEEDRSLFGVADPDNETLTIRQSDDFQHLVVTIRDGRQAGNRIVVFDAGSLASLADPARDVEPVTGRTLVDSPEVATRFVGSRGDRIWLWTFDGAPNGKVLVTDLGDEEPTWRTAIAEGSAPIDRWIGARRVGEHLAVGTLDGGRRIVRLFDLEGRHRYDLDPPSLGSIWSGLVADDSGRHAFYSLSGFVDPGTVYRLDLATGRSTVFERPELPYDPDEVVTRRVHYQGPAGPAIPMILAHHRDVEVDGSRPVMVYGYGFGGWASGPWFRAHLWEFFRLGGVFALPALRGGGELGEDWHRAGIGRQRQNAVDDYVAAIEWLIDQGLARPERVVAETQSAGASLVGAALVQRPDLFGAGILAFPLLDLLRYESYTAGVRWRSELGTVEDAEDRRAMLAYSPIHNVDPERCYPPMLLLPGENDELTPPMHAYKLASALEGLEACDSEVLLRVAWGAGHTYGTTPEESAASFADQIAFVLRIVGATEEDGASSEGLGAIR